MAQPDLSGIQLPLTFYPRRLPIAAMSAALIAAAVLFLRIPAKFPYEDYFCSGISALMATVVLATLLPNRTYLRLTEQGIEIGQLFGRARVIPWREVTQFYSASWGGCLFFDPQTIGWDYKMSALDKPYFDLLPPAFYFRHRDLKLIAAQLNDLRQRYS